MRSICFALLALSLTSTALADEKAAPAATAGDTVENAAKGADTAADQAAAATDGTTDAAATADDAAQKRSDRPHGGLHSSLPDTVVAIDKISAVQLDDLLSANGFAVKEAAEGSDAALVWKIEGFDADILLGREHQVIQVHTAFDVTTTLEKVNLWNRDNLFTHAFIDEQNKPCIELELDLSGGVTTDRVIDFFKMSREAVLSFSQAITKP